MMDGEDTHAVSTFRQFLYNNKPLFYAANKHWVENGPTHE